jgi:hypothetical protein
VSTLNLFKTILDDQKSLPRDQPHKDLITLVNFILRRFFKSLAEEPFLAIEVGQSGHQIFIFNHNQITNNPNRRSSLRTETNGSNSPPGNPRRKSKADGEAGRWRILGSLLMCR